jgi:N-acylneuraminate cytidylyltransferase
MGAVAIIPARGGSTRIPKKNIRDFHGKPIIAYSIETARSSGLFDRVIVSTDSDEIAQVARQYGVEVLMRSDEMAQNDVGTQAVMRYVLGEQLGLKDGFAGCIYPTAPLMLEEDLFYGCGLINYGNRYAMSVGDAPLADAGQWYLGRISSFVEGLPLIHPCTAMVPIPANRVCDINTFDDWSRAEELYKKLKG